MTFDLQKIVESKQALRRKLSARPVAEKLLLLDHLRERALTLIKRGGGGFWETRSLLLERLMGE